MVGEVGKTPVFISRHSQPILLKPFMTNFPEDKREGRVDLGIQPVSWTRLCSCSDLPLRDFVLSKCLPWGGMNPHPHPSASWDRMSH